MRAHAGLLPSVLTCLISMLLSLPQSTKVSFAEPRSLPTEIAGVDRVNGQAVSVRVDHAARGTVVVFVSAKCPCSASHEAPLRKYAREFGPQGFQFVAVHSNHDESAELAQAHFKQAELGFAVIGDSDARLANAFGALKTPHAFVLSPSGEVIYEGGVDDSKDYERAQRHFLRDALSAVAAGKSPETRVGRALGCVIKRGG